MRKKAENPMDVSRLKFCETTVATFRTTPLPLHVPFVLWICSPVGEQIHKTTRSLPRLPIQHHRKEIAILVGLAHKLQCHRSSRLRTATIVDPNRDFVPACGQVGINERQHTGRGIQSK